MAGRATRTGIALQHLHVVHKAADHHLLHAIRKEVSDHRGGVYTGFQLALPPQLQIL